MLNVAHVKNDAKWRPIVKFGTLIENKMRMGLFLTSKVCPMLKCSDIYDLWEPITIVIFNESLQTFAYMYILPLGQCAAFEGFVLLPAGIVFCNLMLFYLLRWSTWYPAWMPLKKWDSWHAHQNQAADWCAHPHDSPGTGKPGPLIGWPIRYITALLTRADVFVIWERNVDYVKCYKWCSRMDDRIKDLWIYI